MAWPSQMAPPFSGAGLVQLRVLFWKPRPQRLLHTDHSVHVDQPPFTTPEKRQEMLMSGWSKWILNHSLSYSFDGKQSKNRHTPTLPLRLMGVWRTAALIPLSINQWDAIEEAEGSRDCSFDTERFSVYHNSEWWALENSGMTHFKV